MPSYNNLTKLTEQTLVKFARGNPATFLPEDPVVFKLKVKNAQRIIFRVFEVKTLEYLQQHTGAVGKALNLDGLSPNWEQTLSFDYPPIELHEVQVELPELANRRGAFVMDVICNGENSSAYFTKVREKWLIIFYSIHESVVLRDGLKKNTMFFICLQQLFVGVP